VVSRKFAQPAAVKSHGLCFGTGEVPSAVSNPVTSRQELTNQSRKPISTSETGIQPDFYLDYQLPVGMYVWSRKRGEATC
jgi:hypothetical protein